MKSKSMTWGKLKEFANSLNETQLQEPVRWWGEERGGLIGSAYQLEEDYVVGDESVDPKSTYDNPEDYEDYEVFDKGTPILGADEWDADEKSATDSLIGAII